MGEAAVLEALNDQFVIVLGLPEDRLVKFQKICVLGLGYIGLPTASTFATHGLEVVGVDVNPSVIETLRNGGLHIHEPGLRTLVQAALGSGNLRISESPEPADAYIIAVPTPILDGHTADLSYVEAAAKSIVPCLSRGNLVVLESTSPPTTTECFLTNILQSSGLTAGRDYCLAYTPERVLPGQILSELIENARVIGGVDRRSAEAGRDLYRTFVRGEIFLTGATTAEMVKLMENTYRDINIAIANEFSHLAEKFGIDVWQAIQIANHHPRVDILRPGPGVGGHCIGVDPWFLVEAAPELTDLIRAAREVNDRQPLHIVEMVEEILSESGQAESLQGVKVAALGLSYKPDVDDLRESPALSVSSELSQRGAFVKAYEPYLKNKQQIRFDCVDTLQEALADVDLILLLVPHAPFLELKPEQVAKLSHARLIVDTVNAWSSPDWESYGFSMARLGVGKKRISDRFDDIE